MRRLREQNMNLTRRGEETRPAPRTGSSFAVLVLIAVALLVLSRLDHSALRAMRWQIAEWLAPVLAAAAVPLEPVRALVRRVADQERALADAGRLREENRRLEAAAGRLAELERANADLADLAGVVRAQPLPFVSGRVVSQSTGAFVRSVTIDAGHARRIRSGHPVIDRNGVVGRVVETGSSAARVLLLTDINSKVPVEIGQRGVRAVLAGDNGPLPHLVFVAERQGLAAGDEVRTSGIGGVFPRGLRVGRVIGEAGGLRVEPFAALDALEHVAVLLFDSAGLELYADPANAAVPSPTATAPLPGRIQ